MIKNHNLFATLMLYLIFISSPSFAKSDVEWNPDEIDIQQTQGTQSSQVISITFSKDANGVEATVNTELQQWVTISPSSIGDISKGNTLDITITIDIPSDALIGTYDGVIRLSNKKNKKNKKKRIGKPLPIALTIIESDSSEPSDDEPQSPGSISTEFEKGVLYPVGNNVTLTLSDALFSTDAGEVTLLNNDKLISSFTVNPSFIFIPSLLVDGINNIVLYANDSEKAPIYFEISLWAGSNSTFINVVNVLGEPITADLKIRLADDNTVGFDGVSNDGIYEAANLPSRTVIVEAVTATNEFGSGALIGGMDSTITITVKGIGEPSNIDNNDFSQGLSGWGTNGNGTVSLVPETE